MKKLSVILLIGLAIACNNKEGDKISTLEIRKLSKLVDTVDVQTPASANFTLTANKLQWSCGSGLDYKERTIADSVASFKVLKIMFP